MRDARIRLLLVYQDERLASSRIRVLEMAPWLERLGAEVECRAYPEGPAQWRALLARAASADVVLLQKKLPGILAAALLRRLRAPLVFDFDDAIPLRQHPRGGVFESATRARRFARVVRAARAIVAGNEHLAKLCGRPPEDVLVCPSAVPTDVPLRWERPANALARIGWIGGRGNLDQLEELAAPLGRLAQRHELCFVVISDERPRAWRACPLEWIPWSAQDQGRELARLDIGVMPLADTPWNRGKCAYKLLQYMATGVACVVSPVGMNAQVVEPARNGLLADTPEAWERALERLLSDPALRDALGRAGRSTVEREFAYPVLAERLLRFLRSVERPAPGPPVRQNRG